LNISNPFLLTVIGTKWDYHDHLFLHLIFHLSINANMKPEVFQGHPATLLFEGRHEIGGICGYAVVAILLKRQLVDLTRNSACSLKPWQYHDWDQ
jgi:hypothetical protein